MDFFSVLIVLVMAATAAVLLTGIAGFIHGGSFNEKYGNRLMQARVALQAIAVLLIAILLLMRG
jgi:hypothetical protein